MPRPRSDEYHGPGFPWASRSHGQHPVVRELGKCSLPVDAGSGRDGWWLDHRCLGELQIWKRELGTNQYFRAYIMGVAAAFCSICSAVQEGPHVISGLLSSSSVPGTLLHALPSARPVKRRGHGLFALPENGYQMYQEKTMLR